MKNVKNVCVHPSDYWNNFIYVSCYLHSTIPHPFVMLLIEQMAFRFSFRSSFFFFCFCVCAIIWINDMYKLLLGHVHRGRKRFPNGLEIFIHFHCTLLLMHTQWSHYFIQWSYVCCANATRHFRTRLMRNVECENSSYLSIPL